MVIHGETSIEKCKELIGVCNGYQAVVVGVIKVYLRIAASENIDIVDTGKGVQLQQCFKGVVLNIVTEKA